MSCHSSLLRAALAVLVAIPVPTALAQGSDVSGSSPVEVVYVWGAASNNQNGVTVETYNVDRWSGAARSLGQVTLPIQNVWTIQPAANDRFIYVYDQPLGGPGEVLVYPTDASGIPQTTSIQRLNWDGWTFRMDPDGILAFGIGQGKSQQGIDLVAAQIDPATGLVHPPKVVAREPSNGPCSQWLMPDGPNLVGFNAGGTQLYEEWSCDGYDDVTSTYYTRSIDQQTGALGPPMQTVVTYGGLDQGTSVSFAPDGIIEFTGTGGSIDGNYLSLFPLWGGTNPVFTCTNQMLEECGNATTVTVDPSGQNLLFQITSDTVEIARIVPQQKEVVGTGSYLIGSVASFSPDDRLIYVLQGPVGGPYNVAIYAFEPGTGAVSYNIGGLFNLPQNYWFAPALRR